MGLVICQSSSDVENKKTTEAVVSAVSNVESKQEPKEDKKADAVVAATMNVLKTQGGESAEVSQAIVYEAQIEAKKTFKDLDNANVGTKAAADAAAKVAVAEIDGASDTGLKQGVKDNAEKAAVAAGKSVADHPDSLASAVSE